MELLNLNFKTDTLYILTRDYFENYLYEYVVPIQATEYDLEYDSRFKRGDFIFIHFWLNKRETSRYNVFYSYRLITDPIIKKLMTFKKEPEDSNAVLNHKTALIKNINWIYLNLLRESFEYTFLKKVLKVLREFYKDNRSCLKQLEI